MEIEVLRNYALPFTAGLCEEAVSRLRGKMTGTGEPSNAGLWTERRDIMSVLRKRR